MMLTKKNRANISFKRTLIVIIILFYKNMTDGICVLFMFAVQHCFPLTPGGSSSADKLVRDSAQGRLEAVKVILDAHPSQVDMRSGGKTALQVAAHQGHTQLVAYLLSIGAFVNAVDTDGDTTLHYAAFGNKPDV